MLKIAICALMIILTHGSLMADHTTNYAHKHYVRPLAHSATGHAQVQLWNPGPKIVVVDEIRIISSGTWVLLRNDGEQYKLPNLYSIGVPVDFQLLCSQGGCSSAEIRYASGSEVEGTQLEQFVGGQPYKTGTPYVIHPGQGIMFRPGNAGEWVRITFKWHER